jgi:hypothetical protein
MERKFYDFWTQTLSCTLGTVIGIVLTFGTSAWIEYRERQEMERTAALMVIHNLDSFCEDLDEAVKDLQPIDSICFKVLGAKDRLETIPEDTLDMFVNSFLSHSFNTHDQTTETIFSSNIETWKSIDNREFIDLAGNCFSAKKLMVKFQERLEEEKNDLTDLFLKTIAFGDKPPKSVHEKAAAILRSATFCTFIVKQHSFYLYGFKTGQKLLREKTEKCKQMMNVTDEELQEFSKND